MEKLDQGSKWDTGKADLSLVSWCFLEQVANVFTFGAELKKPVPYGRANYRKGLSAARILAAAGRHLWALLRGEEMDPESGLPHWAHVACCMQMYADCQRLGTLREDRLLDPMYTKSDTVTIIKELVTGQGLPVDVPEQVQGKPNQWVSTHLMGGNPALQWHENGLSSQTSSHPKSQAYTDLTTVPEGVYRG